MYEIFNCQHAMPFQRCYVLATCRACRAGRSAVANTSDSRARDPGFGTRSGNMLSFLFPLIQGQFSWLLAKVCALLSTGLPLRSSTVRLIGRLNMTRLLIVDATNNNVPDLWVMADSQECPITTRGAMGGQAGFLNFWLYRTFILTLHLVDS